MTVDNIKKPYIRGEGVCHFCGKVIKLRASTHTTCSDCKKHLINIAHQVTDDIRRFAKYGSYDFTLASHPGYKKRSKLEIDYDNQHGSRVCTKCHIRKPFAEFYKQTNNASGVSSQCRYCIILNACEYAKNRSELFKRKQLLKKYSEPVDTAKYKEIIEAEECQICGKKSASTLHVDHCHSSNKVRGVLCMECNLGLGKFKDDLNLLEKAITYLKQFNGQEI